MEAGARARGGLTALPRAWWFAAAWCAVFAVLHLYWGLGGEVGLASSAGVGLASTRPLPFVLVGLFGVAVLLAVGAALMALLGTGRLHGRWRTFARGLALVVGVVLLLRGVALEVALLADLGGLPEAVGPAETFWSLVLWNPWFVLGGLLFLLASRRDRCAPTILTD